MIDEVTLLLLVVLIMLVFLIVILSLRRKREVDEESFIAAFLKKHHLKDKSLVSFVEKNFKKESMVVDSLFFALGFILFLFGLFRNSILFVVLGFAAMLLCLYLFRQLLKIEKHGLFSGIPAMQKVSEETRAEDKGA